MNITSAIEKIKNAGFADATAGCGRVYFRDVAGQVYSIRTDFKAEVSEADVDRMIRAARAAPVARSTRTDDNAAYRRDMIDAGRGHLLR